MIEPLVAAAIFFSFFFINASFLGIGISFFLIIVMLILKTAYIKDIAIKRRSLTNTILWVYVTYSIWVTISFYLGGYTQNEDLRYLVSVWAVSFVFILIPAARKKIGKTFENGVRKGVVTTTMVILMLWLVFFVSSQDYFVLRKINYYSYNWLDLTPTLFYNPNLFARVSLLLLSLLIYFHFISTKESKTMKIMILGLIITIVSSLSRANIFSLLVICLGVVFLLFKPSKKIISLILLSLSIFSIILLSPQFYDRVTSLSEYSFTSGENLRSISWRASLEIIKENPWIGIGVSNESSRMFSFGSVTNNFEQKIILTHGGFLKVAVYSGLIGFVLFLIIIARAIYLFAKEVKKSNVNERKVAPVMGLLIVLAMIPMNTGADGFGLLITWFTIAFYLEASSNHAPTVRLKRI